MEIKNLQHIPLPSIVDCLLESFADYFVKMPEDVQYWENRFLGARVNFELSFGMFDDGKLIGFIINGIDYTGEDLTAFNTGTGVIPAYRGDKIVDSIYDFAIPVLKKNGVKKCMLEVIQKNEKAIRVYERIGFSSHRSLKCFKGSLKTGVTDVGVKKANFEHIIDKQTIDQQFYSWDNNNEAILSSGNLYHTFEVFFRDSCIGYFVINPKIGYLPQFELYDTESEYQLQLFEGIRQVAEEVRINNVDASRIHLCDALLQAGLENHIDQFEMEMKTF